MADRDGKGRFLAGNNGGGRPKGSRNKLATEFFDALYEDWKEHGVDAVAATRENEPATYVRVVASLMPKETEVTLRKTAAAELSDDELAGIIAERGSNGTAGPPVDPSQLN